MDDLLDLNFSASAPAKKGSSGNFPKPPSNSAFTSASGFNSNSRSNSPATFDLFASAQPKSTGYSSPAFNSTPLRNATPSQAQSVSTAAKTSNLGPDAFSDLLSSFGPSSAGGSSVNSRPASGMGMNMLGSNMSGLTLVERQAKMAQEKKDREERERQAFDFDSWGDSLGAGSSAKKGSTANGHQPILPVVSSVNKAPGKNLLQPVPRKPEALRSDKITSLPSKPLATSDWGFDDLLSSPKTANNFSRLPAITKPSVSSKPTGDQWDLEALASQSKAPLPSSRASNGQGLDSLGEDHDDLLGDLARPAAKRVKSPPMPAVSQPAPSARASSPPPHIVGQIVEMGFSPAQARKALAKTTNGADVEAAIAMLVGEGSSDSPREPREERQSSRMPEDMDEEAAARERRRRRRQGPTRADIRPEPEVRPRSRQPKDGDDSQAFGDVTAQADKILAQASEIGMNVFSKAGSLWSQGKERAQKLYEERQAALAAADKANGTKPRDGDGRPRWMIDAEEAEQERSRPRRDENGGSSKTATFKDSDDDEGPEEPVARRPPPSRQRERSPPAFTSKRPEPQAAPRSEPRVADLFSESAPVYKSAGRRKPLESSREPTSAAGPSRTPIRTQTPTSTPLITRPVVPVPRDRIVNSTAKKAAGNENFKLGRFSEAADFYTAALNPLPTGHLLTVPLLNNRAAARVKSGDHAGAIVDCSQVIEIIGIGYHPAKETPLGGDLADVKLVDGLFKALSKRAGAYEMAEKWHDAKEDWERLMGHAVAAAVFASPHGPNQRKMVSDGLARTRAMLKPPSTASAMSSANGAASKPKPRAAPSVRRPDPVGDANKSKGVAKMREANAAQEAEDNERVNLKVGVDAKIQAWSAGKETNLRGLLSSLDLVLWDGLGVKKPSMAELITEKQVKIGYMRIIGKLHPDKVSMIQGRRDSRNANSPSPCSSTPPIRPLNNV